MQSSPQSVLEHFHFSRRSPVPISTSTSWDGHGGRMLPLALPPVKRSSPTAFRSPYWCSLASLSGLLEAVGFVWQQLGDSIGNITKRSHHSYCLTFIILLSSEQTKYKHFTLNINMYKLAKKCTWNHSVSSQLPQKNNCRNICATFCITIPYDIIF